MTRVNNCSRFVRARSACAALAAGLLGLAGTCHGQTCVIPGDTIFADGFQPATSQTYYVATNGDNGHDGSINAPWLTLQHAADAVGAGDLVCVRGGVYNELVAIVHSGSVANGAITFTSYPGETAIVDGTGLVVPNGQAGLITIADQSYINIEGFELRNYATASTADVPIGIYITGAGTALSIRNNHIHHIATTAQGCAANAFGLTVNGTQAPASINNLTISGNEVDHLTTGCSESLSLNGNVENWIISHNSVHDNNNIAIGAIGFEGTAPDVAFDQARDGEISDNVVYNITSFGNPAYGNQYAADGIYVDGGTRIVIERNEIHNVDLGIELASEHSGHVSSDVIARSNLIYFGNSAGISIGGYDATVGGTDQCTIVNNSLLGNDTQQTGSGEFQIQYYATNNVFENNIVYATTLSLFVNNATSGSGSAASLNYNIYYSTMGAAAGIWVWDATEYDGFGVYQSGTGLDASSAFADPQFVNLTTPDLRVAPASPAVNAGTKPGPTIVGTEDFTGNPRVQGANIDIGAYEQ